MMENQFHFQRNSCRYKLCCMKLKNIRNRQYAYCSHVCVHVHDMTYIYYIHVMYTQKVCSIQCTCSTGVWWLALIEKGRLEWMMRRKVTVSIVVCTFMHYMTQINMKVHYVTKKYIFLQLDSVLAWSRVTYDHF